MTFKLARSYKGITNYTKEVRSAKHGIYKKKRDSERNQTIIAYDSRIRNHNKCRIK